MIHYATTHVPGVSPLRDEVVAMQRIALPALEVFDDSARRGLWATARDAFLTLASRSEPGDHVVVLADDMQPCEGFAELLDAAVTCRPRAAICMFSMRQCVTTATAAGIPWVETADGCWGGATLLPVGWVQPFIEWADATIAADYKHDDRRLAYWLHRVRRVPVWVTAPSLLQHVGAGESLLGNSNRRRISENWTDRPAVDFADPRYLSARTAPGAWVKDVEANMIGEPHAAFVTR